MDYHISKGEKQSGPFSLEQVKSFLQSGTYNRQDLAWRIGMDSWAPISSLPEFLSADEPPPIPQNVPNISLNTRQQPSPLPSHLSEPESNQPNSSQPSAIEQKDGNTPNTAKSKKKMSPKLYAFFVIAAFLVLVGRHFFVTSPGSRAPNEIHASASEAGTDPKRALSTALVNCDLNLLRKCIEQLHNVNYINDKYDMVGETPLASAVLAKDKYIKINLDIDATNNPGGNISEGTKKELAKLEAKDWSEYVKILLDAGADVNMKGTEGKSALDWANQILSETNGGQGSVGQNMLNIRNILIEHQNYSSGVPVSNAVAVHPVFDMDSAFHRVNMLIDSQKFDSAIVICSFVDSLVRQHFPNDTSATCQMIATSDLCWLHYVVKDFEKSLAAAKEFDTILSAHHMVFPDNVVDPYKEQVFSSRLWGNVALNKLADAMVFSGDTGRLGIDFRKHAKGVLITGINENSPAYHDHLKAGDLVTSFNNVPLVDISDDSLKGMIRSTQKGQRVFVEMVRDSVRISGYITIGLTDSPYATSIPE